LIGLTLADPTHFDDLPLKSSAPRAWRYARYAAAVVVPVGVLFAAHRISEPEGLEAAEQPSSALAFVTAPDSGAPATTVAARPPARSFEIGSFGHSNAVRVRVALPNDAIRLPIDFAGSTDGMDAQWIAFDGKANEPAGPWPSTGVLHAPSRPGAFWLMLSRGGVTDTIADLALLVEHPMPNTMATGINGYHLGRWPKAADGIVPRGFIEVPGRLSDFPLSPHLRLSDFVVHDAQDGFPKYLHVRESLLDKIELVVAEIAQMRGRNPALVKLNVASGFRSPAHNDEVSGTAQDSRHIYGDAADIAIDANNDGKLTEIDARLVAAAAEVVERKYPDLVGGVGLYITTEGAGWPYVHIDTRGKRARWRGGAKRGGAIDSLPDNAGFDSVTSAIAAAAPQAAAHKPTTRAAAPKRPAAALSRHSAAAHSRSGRARAKPSSAAHSRSRATARKPATTARTKPRATTGAPPAAAHPASDDPFSSAARKFRTPRP
jgi:Peptidase M15